MSTRKKERIKTVLRRFDYGNNINLEFTYHSSKALKKFKKQLISDIKNSKSLDYGNFNYYKFLCVVLKKSDYTIELNSGHYPFYIILSFDISKLYQSFFSELPNSRNIPHLRWEDHKYSIYDGYREVNNARKILNEYNSKIFSAKAELNDYIISINVKELFADLWDHLYEEIPLAKYKENRGLIQKCKKNILILVIVFIICVILIIREVISFFSLNSIKVNYLGNSTPFLLYNSFLGIFTILLLGMIGISISDLRRLKKGN